MDSTSDAERIDIFLESDQKIGTATGPLRFVEVKSLDQVILSLIANLDPHEVRSEIRFLAVSQSAN